MRIACYYGNGAGAHAGTRKVDGACICAAAVNDIALVWDIVLLAAFQQCIDYIFIRHRGWISECDSNPVSHSIGTYQISRIGMVRRDVDGEAYVGQDALCSSCRTAASDLFLCGEHIIHIIWKITGVILERFQQQETADAVIQGF